MLYVHKKTGERYQSRGPEYRYAGVLFAPVRNLRLGSNVTVHADNLEPRLDQDEPVAPVETPRPTVQFTLEDMAFALARRLSWNLGNAVTAIVAGDLATAKLALEDEGQRLYPVREQPEEAS